MSQKQFGAMAPGTIRVHGGIKPIWRLMLVFAFCLGFMILEGVAVAGVINGYGGVSFGYAMGKFDKESFSFDTKDLSRDEAVWRVFAGSQIHKNLGIEAGYIDFRKARVSEEVYEDYFETAITGFDVTPVGILPVGSHFSVFARAGMIFWNSDMTSRYAISDTSTKSESGSGLALAAGGSYDLGKWITLRAEYARYAVGKTKAGAGDFNILWVSGIFVFTP